MIGNQGHQDLLHYFLKSKLNHHFSLVIAIGKHLKLSPAFPPLHTVRATFTAHGVPSNLFAILLLHHSIILEKCHLFKSIVFCSFVYIEKLPTSALSSSILIRCFSVIDKILISLESCEVLLA